MPFPIRIILPEGKCEHVQNSLWENKGLVSSVIFYSRQLFLYRSIKRLVFIGYLCIPTEDLETYEWNIAGTSEDISLRTLKSLPEPQNLENYKTQNYKNIRVARTITSRITIS